MSLLLPKGRKIGRVKPKRLVDKSHLARVAEKACCCCRRWPVEVHHLLRGPFIRGTGRKSGDNWCIPMCTECHRGLHGLGNETEYLEAWHVDGPALALELWANSK